MSIHPTREECEKLLEKYNTPEHVRKHCRAVAETAFTIGEALNRSGAELDLELIMSAGLLHDIARVEEKHDKVGAEIVAREGYKEEADIIRTHMRYDFFANDEINETDLVCLADRLVLEDKYAGLDDRIDYIIQKAIRNGHHEAKKKILMKKEETGKFMEKIEEKTGCSIDELMKGKA